MSLDVEVKLMKLTSEKRKVLQDGEALLKQQREMLGVEKFCDIYVLTSHDVRIEAEENFSRYQDLLEVEMNFYAEFHRQFLEDINSLVVADLVPEERGSFLERCVPGLIENDAIRTKIIYEKREITAKFLKIIDVFNAQSVSGSSANGEIYLNDELSTCDVNRLSEEINDHLETQKSLARVQRQRAVDGQRLISRIFHMLKGG